MSTKIRLQRHGRKNHAFYTIVIAESKSPRDGRFIEKLGTFDPNTNPATVDLNFEKALKWVLNGAQPTDTVRNILSREGIYMKKHLLGGVAKGAFGEAEAETKFEAWKKDKETRLENAKSKDADAKKNVTKTRLEAEAKINEAKAKILADKKAAINAAKAAESAAKAAKEKEAAEAIEKQKKAAEAAKAPKEEVAVEAPKEETPAEAPKEEAPVEAPKEEAAPKE
ncbi:MAG: 30S ribosomal protein S16 [Bacteroidaceae bacterium]|nr:30S ribosomal protein S16 [Bacteroidaceae bacterium]